MMRKTLLTFFLTLSLSITVHVQSATPSPSLGFQGQLYSGATPLSSSVNATFTFYDALTGGAITGSSIPKTITVVNGYFGTQFTPSDTTGVDFNQQLYIEVSINGTILSPRTTVNPTVSSLKTFGTFSYATPPAVGPSGNLYFNTTTGELYVSTGSIWQLAGTASSTNQWTPNGTSLNYMAGNVGIGTTSATDKLTVAGDTTITGLTKLTGGLFLNGDTITDLTGSGLVVSGGSLSVSTTSLGLLTTNVAEGTNLYYTDERARNSQTNAVTGIDYASSTGTWTLTTGYNIPLVASTSQWSTAYASTSAMTPAYFRGLLSSTATGLTYTSGTGVTSLTAGYSIPLTASSTNWNNFFNTPSTQITAGTNLSWSGNTLNASVSTSGINYLRLVSGGLETSTTTDFLRAAYFVASSTTGTSTFANAYFSGNVGIGTTTPLYTLDVAGDINTTGKVRVAGTQAIYIPGGDFEGTMYVGDGGSALSYVSGSDGKYNTAMGIGALFSNTTGNQNSAQGYRALYTNTTGYNNSAQGYQSLYFNTTGYNNSAQGYQALRFNTTGYSNSAQGVSALYANTTGANNSAQGVNALHLNTTGNQNSAQGANALYFNTTGSNNSAQGANALYANTTGSNNSAQGANALYANTTGSNNSAQGPNALYANTTGSNNSAVGYQAGYGVSTASNITGNSLFGYQSGLALLTGADYNTLLGYSAGSTITTGARNIIIGYNTTAPVITGNDQLNIGNLIYGNLAGGNVGIGTTTPSARLAITGQAGTGDIFAIASSTDANMFIVKSSGKVGIGTTTPSELLTVVGNIQSTALLGGITTLSVDANGNIIRTPSDSKLKTNVETITSALEKVNQMRGVSYNWLDTSRFGPDKEIGFIAQELETVVPEVVKSGGEYKSVNYQNLVALLVEAIKELSVKIADFRNKFTTKELCLEDVCINKDQLRTILQQSAQQSSGYAPQPPVDVPPPPVVTSSSTEPIVDDIPAETPPIVDVPVINPPIVDVPIPTAPLAEEPQV